MGTLGYPRDGGSQLFDDGKTEKQIRIVVGYLLVLGVLAIAFLPPSVQKWYLFVGGLVVLGCARPQELTIADHTVMDGSVVPVSVRHRKKEVGGWNSILLVCGLIMALIGGTMVYRGCHPAKPAAVGEQEQGTTANGQVEATSQ